MKRFGMCFLFLGIYIMCFAGCQTARKEEWEKRLYVPTMIQKIDDTYFIVDCWQHRVIYSRSLDSDISKWNTMTDEDYIGGHTVASDGEVYLLDNTDSNEVLVYVKSGENYEKSQTIKGIQGRPHYVLYDESADRFLVIGSMVGKIYVFDGARI